MASPLVFLLPEAIQIVEDRKDPLYDPRVERPIDEAAVVNVMAFGILEPVIVRKAGGGRAVCVAGRQRVRWALEANRRLAADGRAALKVPCIFRRGATAAESLAVSVAENEIRSGDSVLEKAAKAARMARMGRTVEEIRTAFGATQPTVSRWLALADLHHDVQELVTAGRLQMTEAIRIGRKHLLADQPAAARALAEQRQTKRDAARAAREARRAQIPAATGTQRHGEGRALRRPVEDVRRELVRSGLQAPPALIDRLARALARLPPDAYRKATGAITWFCPLYGGVFQARAVAGQYICVLAGWLGSEAEDVDLDVLVAAVAAMAVAAVMRGAEAGDADFASAEAMAAEEAMIAEWGFTEELAVIRAMRTGVAPALRAPPRERSPGESRPLGDGQKALLRALASGAPMTAPELAAAAREPYQRVWFGLRGLVRRGLVVKEGERYRAAERPETARTLAASSRGS